ncbi:hypothetical protein GGR28_000343 [Lewinella aquimaris]|uniref:Glycosyltransferase RgtA/B/C/D-like domain-containing protein n=1 Tax=Neolewinella aquimaris TaxID=1835722 RepID=A0A840E1V9_9BACT|nr:glycosyltransferase family 39 protein [Neolewinella aquimaris]MBB4077742.1 hypothetical protein [Neolewinella aquimaris]
MNHRLIVSLFFLTYFIVGYLIVDDYGITYDEAVQRRHGHVTVEYVADRFGIDHPPLATEGKSFSQYGMIYQIVATLAEIELGAIEDPYRYYRIRHVMNYLLFGIALMFFYRTLRLRWPTRRWFPLIGTVVLLLSPRIFAHAFFNPKDHILLVFYLIATYTLLNFLRKRTNRALAFHVLASALALNTRLPAMIILAATVLILVWEQLFEKPNGYRRLVQAAVYLPATLLLMLPFFPYLWVDTGSRLTGAITKMSDYSWDSSVLLFGDYIHAMQLPAYYIPAWIAITTPIVYLAFMFVGIWKSSRESISGVFRGRLWRDFSGQMDFVQLGLSIGPILVVIILNSTLYNGWRHLHFVYPGLVYLLMVGYDTVATRYRKWAMPILAAGIVVTAINMVRMHPQQQVYFNALISGDPILRRFDMDYWGAGYREALVKLADQIPEGETRRVKCQNWPCIDNIRALPPAARAKIINEPQWHLADYVATNFLYPEEREQIGKREVHFAHPVVEIAPRRDISIGIYKINHE